MARYGLLEMEEDGHREAKAKRQQDDERIRCQLGETPIIEPGFDRNQQLAKADRIQRGKELAREGKLP